MTGATVSALVDAAGTRLGSGREARWVVAHVLGTAGAADTSGDGTVPPQVCAAVMSLVDRRRAGEPLQYVLGCWPFRGVELVVDPRVLVPRPETEQVVEVALTELERACARRRPDQGGRNEGSGGSGPVVIDLGTGSGAIAASVVDEAGGRHPELEVWATDASAAALEVARRNLAATRTAAEDRCGSAAAVHVAQGSWFDALPAALAGSVTLVVSNPPYVSTSEYPDLEPVVRDWEPVEALVAGDGTDGTGGLAAIETIVGTAGRWLAPEGALVVEIAPHQADAAASCAGQVGFDSVRVELDLAGRPRALVARVTR